MSALVRKTVVSDDGEEVDEEWGLPAGPNINEGAGRLHPSIIEFENEHHKYDCGDLDFE